MADPPEAIGLPGENTTTPLLWPRLPSDDALTKVMIGSEIWRIRRALGIKRQPTELEIKERRAKTLVRIRRYREKKRHGAARAASF